MAGFPSRRGFFSTVAACLAAAGLRPRRTVAAPVLPPAGPLPPLTVDGTYSVTVMAYDGESITSQPFTWQVSPSHLSNAGTKAT